MPQYLTWFYWTNSRPTPIGEFGTQILFGIAIISAILIIILATRLYKRFFILPKITISSLLWFFSLNIVASLLMWFFNYQIVPTLRARYWYIVWAIAAIIWIWVTIKQLLDSRHEKPVTSNREQEIKKYLPQ